MTLIVMALVGLLWLLVLVPLAVTETRARRRTPSTNPADVADPPHKSGETA